MTAHEVKRKLTAILSADVKGYSRLMGEDEESTARTLNTYKEVMAGLIQHHHGRVVDAPGDNVLAEFASVVDAVRCAVEIQKELKTRNAELPDNRRMEFRIGINLGDVIEEGEKILGEGVNIAARLESLSEARGICISGTAFDHVENKLPLGYEYLGEQAVKNIAKPVRVYRVLMESEATGKVIGPKKAKPRQWRRAALVAIAILGAVAVAFAVWRLNLRPTAPTQLASKEKMASPLPDMPSIAVLPFVNMSDDRSQEYFSDGMTEDIITNLSKISGILVISRNSSFLYKGKRVKIREAARDLGVRYVLEGSIRRMGDKVRVTAQLIDGKTEHHAWADSYDRKLKDIFSVQDEITRKVVSELAVALTEDDTGRLVRRHTENFEAYDSYLRARRLINVLNKESYFRAMELARQAIRLDPNFAGGYHLLSLALAMTIRFGWSASPREDLEKAFELAQKAISVDDKFPFSYHSLAGVYQLQGKHDDAVAAINKGVSIAPNDETMRLWQGFYLNWAGRGDEAIEAIKWARDRNPMYLHGSNIGYLDFMGLACFTAGQYEDSISNFKKSIEKFGPSPGRDPFLIASYIMLGRMEEAKEATQQWLKADPSFTLSSWRIGRQYKKPEDRERLYGALRKAGLPEKLSASIPPSAEVAPKEKMSAPKSEKVSKPVTPQSSREEIASKDKMAFPLPDVPSIAVMPFVNMSGDPKQEFFSDGITEEIITGLTKVPGLFVIARTSTSTYKGKPVKVKQVSEELGVRYVLEGSVQRSSDRIRINAQLIDALTGLHICAERYDRDLKDIFALQDEITMKILMAVQVKLAGGDLSRWKTSYRGKQTLDCYLTLLQAMEYWGRFNIADNNSARRMAQEAIAMCPENPGGYVHLGWVYYFDYMLRNTKSPRETLEKAIELAQKALAMDDSIAGAHGLLGRLYSLKGEHDKAIAEGERAVALNPSGWDVLTNYGNTLTFAGRPEEAIPLLQKVIRLNPFGPVFIYNNLGLAFRMSGRFEEAVSKFKKAIQLAPDNLHYHLQLAGTYGLMGREKEARSEAAEVLRINPKFSLEDFAKTNPFKDRSRNDEFINALRKAGLK